MNRKTVSTSKAPAAIGPYSQAVRSGDFLYCSGQLGLDPASGNLAEGVEAQTKQSLANLEAILASEGLGFGDVVKTTIFLADMADFATMNEVYAVYFAEPYPARSTVAAAGLPRGARVEIEAVAVLPG